MQMNGPPFACGAKSVLTVRQYRGYNKCNRLQTNSLLTKTAFSLAVVDHLIAPRNF